MKTPGNDPGRIPQYLADNPLNQAERILVSKYVIFGNMNKLNISGGKKLYGHVIAIPLDKDMRARAVAMTSPYRLTCDLFKTVESDQLLVDVDRF